MSTLSPEVLARMPVAARLGVQKISVFPGDGVATEQEVAAEVERSLGRLERGEVTAVDIEDL